MRNDFPLLKQTSRNRPLVYLDNAATTQKPQSVLDSMNDYYKRRTPTNKISKSGLDRIKKMSTMREGVRTEILQLVLSER